MAGIAAQAVLDCVALLNPSHHYLWDPHSCTWATHMPAGSYKGIFTTLRGDAPYESLVHHSKRISLSTDAVRSLQALHPYSRLKIINDRQKWHAEIYDLAPTPTQIHLQIAAARWPKYNQKYTDREHYQRGNRIVRNGISYERLLVDHESGALWETDTANLLFKRKGTWYTPAPTESSAMLFGTTVQQLTESGQVQLASIDLSWLVQASHIQVCNALIGRVPVVICPSMPVGGDS